LSLRIGIVAAEPSGDQLASRLMAAIQQQNAEVQFEGVGGENMQALGFRSWVPMEKLSVMGIVEVLKHLPELLSIRRQLVRHWRQNPPGLFIGVDAPDFNLGLEKKLKAYGVPTVHYVCPSIWAWRQGRVKTLQKATDLILSIFPFEVPLLAKFRLKALYAGHPLAQEIQGEPDVPQARHDLHLHATAPVLGLLPGSRMSEVTALAEDFLETAYRLQQQKPQLEIVAPMATDKIFDFVDELRQRQFPHLRIHLLHGQARQVMAAADVVLTASGTATLETMLYHKPMVVAYKVHWLTHFIAFGLKLIRTKFIAMPNILAGEELAPELFQENCNPDNLEREVMVFFDNAEEVERITTKFRQLHEELTEGGIEQVATAVLQLVQKS
jgi:lipid-A-disaccharide synthase